MREVNYIDLFAGAGGLSEGFVRAGFNPIAHVEMNKDACNTIKTRTAYHWLKENGKIQEYYHYLKSDYKDKEKLWERAPKNLINAVINKEIADKTIPDIFNSIDNELGNRNVDLIIGGPPCQAYSVVGRARDPKNMEQDPRNHLYKHYVKFLEKYQPKMFVFENVPGIFSAKNGGILNKEIVEVKFIYDRLLLLQKDDWKRIVDLASQTKIFNNLELANVKSVQTSLVKKGKVKEQALIRAYESLKKLKKYEIKV